MTKLKIMDATGPKEIIYQPNHFERYLAQRLPDINKGLVLDEEAIIAHNFDMIKDGRAFDAVWVSRKAKFECFSIDYVKKFETHQAYDENFNLKPNFTDLLNGKLDNYQEQIWIDDPEDPNSDGLVVFCTIYDKDSGFSGVSTFDAMSELDWIRELGFAPHDPPTFSRFHVESTVNNIVHLLASKR